MSRLASLPARPPTPPKDLCSKNEKSPDAALNRSSCTEHSVDTPADSPYSSDCVPHSSERAQKRVDFTLDVQSIDKTIHTLLKSSQARKPSKSILKSSSNPASSDPPELDLAIPESRDLATMLDDTLHALANPSISTRFDAYMALNGCLKAYSDTPSQEQLVAKLPALTECLRRDLTETKPQDGFRSTQLLSEALKLTSTLLWQPSTSLSLPDEFCVHVASHSINSIVDRSTPKTLVNSFLQLLTIFKFGPKIMTTERVNRLITVLNHIEERVSGRRVMCLRLAIYQRLVQQEHPLMVSRIGDWIEHLFAGLVSELKEVCERAVMLGVTAGTAFGTTESVSKCVWKLFNSRVSDQENSRSFAEGFAHKMNFWILSEEQAPQAPQVWIVPLLFLRSPSRRLSHWEHFNLWMSVPTRSLNSTNIKLRCSANREWSRFIFCLQSELQGSGKFFTFLGNAIKSQLKRLAGPNDQVKYVRQSVLSAYWTLLYYAFRPGQPEKVLDRAWQECIKSMVTAPVKTSLLDLESVCRLLPPLLGDAPRPGWEQKAGNGCLVIPEHLPRIDPRWVRAHSDDVMRVIELVILSDAWTSLKKGADKVMRVWESFLTAIRDAAVKEIKVSVETMKAMATITTLLKKVVTQSFKSDLRSDRCDGLFRFNALFRAAADIIGPLPLSDKRLVQSSASLQAVETPTSRSNTPSGSAVSPIHHLMVYLTEQVDAEWEAQEYIESLKALINTTLSSYSSNQSRLKALREVVCQIVSIAHLMKGSQQTLWELAILAATNVVRDSTRGDASAEPVESPCNIVVEAVKVLRLRIDHVDDRSVSPWTSLLEAAEQILLEVSGPGLVSTLLIEPLAEDLPKIVAGPKALGFGEAFTVLLEHMRWPESLQAVERAHTMLWKTTAPKRSASMLFDGLLGHVASFIQHVYKTGYEWRPTAVVRHLNALASMISTCPTSFSSAMLRQLQPGFAPWVSDAGAKLNWSCADTAAVFRSTVKLWSCIANKLQDIANFDSATLARLEQTLNAGLTSRHRTIVSHSILLWNGTFGKAKGFEYPQELRKILSKLSCIAEISLPGILASEDSEHVEIGAFDFADTPSDLEEVGSPMRSVSSVLKSSARPSALPVHARNDPAEYPRRLIPKPLLKIGEKRQQKMTPTKTPPRLRHDDSQIQFAAIQSSSPISPAFDSQLLTARQKEVRERQNKETSAMFSDIRSSPKTRPFQTRDQESAPGVLDRSRVNLPTSPKSNPPVVPHSAPIEPLLSSSPTPCTRRTANEKAAPAAIPAVDANHHGEDSSLEDIPSSPPVPLPRRQYLSKQTAPPSVFKGTRSSPLKQTRDRESPLLLRRSLSSSIDKSSTKLTDREKQTGEVHDLPASKGVDSANDQPLMEASEDPKEARSRPETEDVPPAKRTRSSSRQEKNTIDQLSMGEQSNKDSGADEIVAADLEDIRRQVMEAPIEPAAEPSSDDENPVSSQIAMEMARAAAMDTPSSQNSAPSVVSNEPEQATSLQKQPKKRGRKPKKPKSPPSIQASAVDEEMLDCIVVSSSPSALPPAPEPVAFEAAGASSRPRRKRLAKDLASEPETAEKAEASRPTKRTRLSPRHLGSETIATSDPVKPSDLVSSEPAAPAESPSEPSDAAGEAPPPDISQPVSATGHGFDIPAADASVMDVADEPSLVDEMRRLLERAKNGVQPAERAEFMSTSMELMKVAMQGWQAPTA